MPGFRRKFTLARLATVPPIVGITFALGNAAYAEWQVSSVAAAVFLFPIFVTGATLRQYLAYYIVAGILWIMSLPSVSHCGIMLPPTAPTAQVGPAQPALHD